MHPSIIPPSVHPLSLLILHSYGKCRVAPCSVFHAINHYHCTALFSYQLPVSLNMNVFGLWEEAIVGGEPRGTPLKCVTVFV